MGNPFCRLWHDEYGQDLTEYGLLLMFVALGAISTMGSLANALKNVFKAAAINLGGRH